MFNQTRIQQDFSAAASIYNHHTPLQFHVLGKLIAYAQMHPHGLILDAGCGTGRLERELPGRKIIQLDLALAMCRHANLSATPAINGDVQLLPFADNVFDVVFSSLTLQWVPHWQKALAEMQRVLKPGGILAVSTFGEGTLRELQDSFAAIDAHPHVSTFINARDVPLTMEEETFIEYYDSALALMQRLKNMGARNKLANQRKSLMTPSQMRKVEEYYQNHFSTSKGIKATWKILYFVARKP